MPLVECNAHEMFENLPETYKNFRTLGMTCKKCIQNSYLIN